MDDCIGPTFQNSKKIRDDVITIGPTMPPGFQSSSSENDIYGPALPPTKSSSHSDNIGIGPTMPPGFQTSSSENNIYGPTLPPTKSSSHSDNIGIGPILPASKLKDAEVDNEIFGPALPPTLKKTAAAEQQRVVGPQLPPGFTRQSEEEEADDDDDHIIGPLPPKDQTVDSKEIIAKEFEERSKRMKDNLTGKGKPKKLEREEWMTELPPVLQGFGMGPRTFRANPIQIGDRSVWTDTPQDKLKRASKKPMAVEIDPSEKYVQERDTAIAKQISNFEDGVEAESLMSLHEKSRKRKLKEESKEGPVRRPFDRDTDLQVNRFDEAAKKRMMKQSAGLSSRFSHAETTGTFL